MKMISSPVYSRFFIASLTVAAILCFSSPASALFYSFGSPTGNLGNSETYTVSGTSITLRGYNNNSTTADLFATNGSGDVYGVGLANNSLHEILTTSFVQMDLLSVWALNPTSISIAFGSVGASESWKIYGSNTPGSLSTLLYTGTTDYPSSFTLPVLPNSYRYIGVQAGNGGILLATLSTSVPVPEPSMILLLSSGLALIILLQRKPRGNEIT